MASQTQNDPPVVTRFRNSLACVPCRSRHVKCDGNRPGCTRCRIDGKSCYFMKSRRGMRNKTLSTVVNLLPSIEPPDGAQCLNPSLGSMTATSPGGGTPGSAAPLTPASSIQYSSYHSPRLSRKSSMTSKSTESGIEKHLDLYYRFFHNAHPWVLPRQHLNSLMHSNRGQIQQLLAAMEFIGSSYTSEGQSASLREKALNIMCSSSLPKTAFSVQASLILAVGVHCCSDFQLARDVIDRGISIALEIGMHFQSFAVLNGKGDPVLEESWRRTWWGLFVVDGSLEAIQKTYNFKTWHVHADVDLPCEEIDYRREEIPRSRTLAEYNERDLAEIDISYSSFTYLIDIIRILGSVMAASVVANEISDSIIDDADGNLVNWKFHLPDDKKEILKANGEVDEPLFQAHMVFNVIHVHLHRLRSRLVHSPIENTARCAPPAPPFDVPNAKRRIYWLSTKKTLDAAEQALDLFTLPIPLANHTPMIVCGVVLSILAQLSACSYVLQGTKYEAARNRIRLGIGTLKEYGKVWPVGHQSLAEVKNIAREVFAMAASRDRQAEQPNLDLGDSNSVDTLDIQGYFEEFGALDYLSMLDIPTFV